jgi:chaperonin GroEL (HSP60 family)
VLNSHEKVNRMAYLATQAGQPVLILKEGTTRSRGKDAQRNNIMAARIIAEAIKTTLGPRGMDKMLIDSLGDITITNDGAAILDKIEVARAHKMIFVEQCENPQSVAILIRAGLERMVDETERALHDALSVVSDVIENNKIVAGGGAVESELTKALREYGPKVGGREQLAIEAFANALEVVPKTLAENAGLDPIDILVELRAAHQKPEGIWMGVDVFTGKIANMHHYSVLEPLNVKEQAIKSAEEAASMILRIDDIIAATKPKEEEEKEKKGPSEEEFGEY